MSRGEIKKLYIIYILEILKKYSDADHRLRQQDIIKYMELDYGAPCERKTISRNIADLVDAGFEIEQDSRGYYYDGRDFEDSELRMLIDSVLASKYIPKKQSASLIDRLVNQSSRYFKKRVRYIHSFDNSEQSENKELFWTLECIDDAIENDKQVAFYYNKYGADKKLHKTRDTKHIVNPYYVGIANGRYYLIGNNDKYENTTNFRIERITDIEILDSKRKPKDEIADFKDGQDMAKHMLEHVYMFSGKSAGVILKVDPKGINDVIDWLGKDIGIRKEKDSDFLIVDTVTNMQAMKYWAVQFGEVVEVLEPQELREQVKETIEKISNKYKDDK